MGKAGAEGDVVLGPVAESGVDGIDVGVGGEDIGENCVATAAGPAAARRRAESGVAPVDGDGDHARCTLARPAPRVDGLPDAPLVGVAGPVESAAAATPQPVAGLCPPATVSGDQPNPPLVGSDGRSLVPRGIGPLGDAVAGAPDDAGPLLVGALDVGERCRPSISIGNAGTRWSAAGRRAEDAEPVECPGARPGESVG